MARIPFIALTFALLVGYLPISNHLLSMRAMQMDGLLVSRQSNMGHDTEEQNSTQPCCDGIAPLSMACSFVLPQVRYVGFPGGNKQVAVSAPAVRPVYIKTVTPPPKT